MAHLIESDTLGGAWLAGLGRLLANGGSEFDLLVEVTASQTQVDAPELAPISAFLAGRGWQAVQTVANTIFPEAIAGTSGDREALYERYRRLAPLLHRVPANWKGLYFERLIDFPLQADPKKKNQLELVIGDLLSQRRRIGPMRHAYEMQIFAPGKDRLPRGFPCMSSLSIHLDDGRLRLAATYRNQYYLQKALGNLLGLARLQHWIAREVGVEPGALSMHAFHAQIDPGVAERDVESILRSSRSRGSTSVS